MRCHSSAKYFYNFTSHLQNNSINVDFYTIRTLRRGYRAHTEIRIRLMDSKKYQTLFVYNLNVCGMVIGYKDTIFKKWFRSLLKSGNFMQNCPVPIGHYYLSNWQLESDLIPMYLYPSDYLIKFYGFYGKYRTKEEDFVADIEIELSLMDKQMI